MYTLFFHRSPNASKVAMLLEEVGADYDTRFVHVGKGEQFFPAFVKISPNSKIPVLVDTRPNFGEEPVAIFESNAILLYLAGKMGVLAPQEPGLHWEMMQWLFWQAAGQGPFSGQSAHFGLFAPDNPYARKRYLNEARRLMTVLDARLEGRDFMVGDRYSIADIACYPWVERRARLCVGIEDLGDFPNVQRWSDSIGGRASVMRAYERLDREDEGRHDLEEFARNMFGHGAAEAKQAAEKAKGAFADLQSALAEPE